MSKKTHGKKTRHPGIYRLPDGKWVIRAYGTDPRTGSPRERIETLPATTKETEAVMALQLLKTEIAEGHPARAIPSRRSLTDCAERWLEAKAERVRASTAEHLTEALSKHILPQLGDLYLDVLNRADIERWVAWAERAVSRSGQLYSLDTLNGWWRVLCQFVRDVCAEGGLPDPIVRVRPPGSGRRMSRGANGRGAGRRERKTLTSVQLGLLLDALREVAPDRYVEVYVLAYTGMRPGEMYALTWADIEEAESRILIRRAHRHGVVDETKTGEPREVALTAAMAELLRAHRKQMLADQHPGLQLGLVFPSLTGGYRGPESLYKPLGAAAEKAGIPVRMGSQVLRRTLNTLLLLEGVDRVVLRSQMGHNSEQMTELYAGVPVEAKRAAVERLEGRSK